MRSIENRISKIEKQFLSIDHDGDLNGIFPGWTKEELASYVVNGIKPEGKIINHGRVYKQPFRKFEGWTKEDLIRYVMAGEKPKDDIKTGLAECQSHRSQAGSSK